MSRNIQEQPNPYNEFLLLEYAQLMQYYEKTLDDRAKTFGYFFSLVGLPTALIAAFGKNLTPEISLIAIAAILFVIGLVGFACYISYHLEVENAASYLKARDDIRTHFRHMSSSGSEVLTLDFHRPVSDEDRINGRIADSRRKHVKVAKFRGYTLSIISSGVFTAAFVVSLAHLASPFWWQVPAAVAGFPVAFLLQYGLKEELLKIYKGTKGEGYETKKKDPS